ncbi:DNA-binding protein [Micrococcus sp. MS-ASIII-49]|uniref:helix-turn-helix domain-containing protein n=1 Tax=Micrococcus sp. MS-ASIII-49 TaxID=1593237 RepID=UPI0005CC2EE6|nr:helix-turn-helix domain-containing protein [Micrococcus sp. MS-ASIII-49]RYD00119.1 DNA-binding protein [Micrococcus sp. MS-ASIII-49]
MPDYPRPTLAEVTAAVPAPLAHLICTRLTWDEVSAIIAGAPPSTREAVATGWGQLKLAQTMWAHQQAQRPAPRPLPEPPAEWLTVKEAADRAGVDVSTARRWAKDEHVEARRVRGTHRINPRSLAEYIEKREGRG